MRGNKKYARALFQRISHLGIKWFAQTTLSIARDEKLLKQMRESGCVFLAIGIESVNQESLGSVNKNFLKVSEYSELIKRIREMGIAIATYFIFGFDNDDERVFDTTLEFLFDNRIDYAIFNILVPLPGTELFRRLEEENRIFDKDWSKYTGENVVFKPKILTPERLQEGFTFVRNEYYKYKKSFSLRDIFVTRRF